MRAILKWTGVLIVLAAAIIVALFVGTRGNYPVAQLVTQDPTLPSEIVNGIRLHMRIAEEAKDAPTVVVLHGGPGADFRSLQSLEALSDQYRIVFYDQRVAGLSERVGADLLTLDGYVSELEAVIDMVSPDSAAILIGHSWGAILAAAFLGRAPDRVRAAVLIEPGYLDTVGFDRWTEESRRYMSGLSYLTTALLTGFRSAHVSGPDPEASGDFLIGQMVRTFANHAENPYHCGAGYTAPGWRFGASASESWRAGPATGLDRIARGARDFDRPVLLVAGACNDWIGASRQRAHAELFNGAELVVIPDAGHDVVWDNPDASLGVIRDFLNDDP